MFQCETFHTCIVVQLISLWFYYDWEEHNLIQFLQPGGSGWITGVG